MSTIVSGAYWFDVTPDTTVLGTLPMFHVTGMQGSMNQPIFTGATVVLMTRWDRDTAAQLIQRYRVTGWTNIATMAIDFLANPESRAATTSPACSASAAAAPPCPKRWRERLKDLTGLDYVEGYGLSETMAPTHINPPDRPKKQCLGIPICDTDARVINPDTLQELGPGEVGEIVSSGPQIFQGYWKNPDATAACFIELDGKRFFRTGDLGRYDEDGYFFMVDRLKRMINASGYKVWPAEVEAIMYGHPDVQEACIIATSDPAPRRDGQGHGRAEGGQPGPRQRLRRSSAGAATTWRHTRSRAWSSSPTVCPSRLPARCSGACCKSAKRKKRRHDPPRLGLGSRMKPEDYPKVWPKQFPKRLTIPATTLWYNLEVAAARYPHKAATIFYDSRLSYAEFKRQAAQLAGFLQQRCGIRKGDRVLLDLQNSPQFMLAYYAILRADAVVVPVSPMNVTEELEHFVLDSGATTAIVAQELYSRIPAAVGNASFTHAIVAAYSRLSHAHRRH